MTSIALAPRASGETGGALSRGRQLVESFEFEAAIESLESVVSDTNASATERIEALEIISVLHFNLRRRSQAHQAYERLLNLDPGHEPTDSSYPPRLLQFFASVRDGFLPQPSLGLEVVARQSPPGIGPVVVEAALAGDTGGVHRGILMLRKQGRSSYQRAVMRRSERGFTAEVGSDEAAGGIAYYVQIQAPSGFLLASEGSEDEPRTFVPEAGAEPLTRPGGDGPGTVIPPGGGGPSDGTGGEVRRGRWYSSWWFWTIVGAVVAGGATTAVVLTLPPAQEPGSLGTRTLP